MKISYIIETIGRLGITICLLYTLSQILIQFFPQDYPKILSILGFMTFFWIFAPLIKEIENLIPKGSILKTIKQQIENEN